MHTAPGVSDADSDSPDATPIPAAAATAEMRPKIVNRQLIRIRCQNLGRLSDSIPPDSGLAVSVRPPQPLGRPAGRDLRKRDNRAGFMPPAQMSHSMLCGGQRGGLVTLTLHALGEL